MVALKILGLSLGALILAVAGGIWLVLSDNNARVDEGRKADIAVERQALQEFQKLNPQSGKAE